MVRAYVLIQAAVGSSADVRSGRPEGWVGPRQTGESYGPKAPTLHKNKEHRPGQ
jgi:hypothetical protein